MTTVSICELANSEFGCMLKTLYQLQHNTDYIAAFWDSYIASHNRLWAITIATYVAMMLHISNDVIGIKLFFCNNNIMIHM